MVIPRNLHKDFKCLLYLLPRGDESPSACQANLSSCIDDHTPWSSHGNCSKLDHHQSTYAKNNTLLNQMAVNDEYPMQSFPMDKYRRSATSSKEPNGIIQRPSTLYADGDNYTSPRRTSPDMLLLQDSENIDTDNNVRQNSNNDKRQLYNMVIVGVEPDISTGFSLRS